MALNPVPPNNTDPFTTHARAPPNAQLINGAKILTAKQLLDQDIPPIDPSYYGEASNSSRNNELFFACFDRVTGDLNNYGYFLPGNIGGYLNANGDILPPGPPNAPQPRFIPIDEAPALHMIIDEQDTVIVSWHYIVTPLNAALFPKFQRLGFQGIRCISEDTVNLGRGIQNSTGGYPTKDLTGRMDVSWEIVNSVGLREKFFCLEFKRPGALSREDFTAPNPQNLMGPGTGRLTDTGKKISRQIIKYAYETQRRLFALCDWDNLVLLALPPRATFNRNMYLLFYRNQAGNQAPQINVDAAWFENRQDFKRILWGAIDTAYNLRAT